MIKILERFIREWRWLSYKIQAKSLGLNDPRGYFSGLLSYKEGITLFKLSRSLSENTLMVEIGCFGGLSSAYLLEGSKNNRALLYSIDPFDSDLEYQVRDESNLMPANKKPNMAEVETKLKIFGLKNFELIQGLSFEVVKKWNKPIDLLWIDGNHDYEAVKQDYQQWEPFLKVGGIIAFHDSNKKDNSEGWSEGGWEGPTRLVKEVLHPPKWDQLMRIDSITSAKKQDKLAIE